MTQNYVVPNQMIAIEVINPGNQSQLQQTTVAVPALKAGQVLLKVAAAGVNRADLLQRSGLYPPPAGESDILGLEVAGTVVAVAADVSSEWLGEAVFGLVPGGGYAQYVALPAEHLIKKPASLGMSEAAACAEVFLTAFQAMRVVGSLPDQGALLVHAGASGVGTAAIQLGKALGCFVAVTVGSDDKAKACLALGADMAVNYKTQDFVTELKAARPQGFDLIIDPVAGDYITKDIQLLALDGQIVVLSMLGGRMTPELDLGLMLKKRGQLLCSTLRNRTDGYKAALISDFNQQFGMALAEGNIRAVLAQSIDWAEAERAHQLLASNAVVGKLVLTLF
ncbi:NAD(P)H-quinone oxidoreductase [uncultured Rheinheimera sp.]|uniref:NAD(P)H-quinone oxidoreductase n=1 Tax=uncultured Rheinheimera sp. TaxID=400532 RepID=UPI00259966D0|nr:NAD(P)H-quinone oxidoreductase [uncultured Rheinheimera sp.]